MRSSAVSVGGKSALSRHRVKIRFHWQQAEAADDRDSCWVRVMQRQAGAGTTRRQSPGGMGWQWLPRIGQEILVDLQGGDIDRPYILGALYNCKGEGGVIPTAPCPGTIAAHSEKTCFTGPTQQRYALPQFRGWSWRKALADTQSISKRKNSEMVSCLVERSTSSVSVGSGITISCGQSCWQKSSALRSSLREVLARRSGQGDGQRRRAWR